MARAGLKKVVKTVKGQEEVGAAHLLGEKLCCSQEIFWCYGNRA